ncbi:O-methyltransferase [Pyrenophora tritici-repentis]|nr:O-methyltransferase [Pyrenophora tritici-repentis]
MSKTNDRTGFLSLPTELRLQIASYALEQLPTDEERLIHLAQPWKTSVYNSVYKSSKNLAIRLVCREFNRDFSRLAIQKTTFVLYGGLGTVIDAQPDELLRDVSQQSSPRERYTQTLLKKLPPSPHILELGCGPGIPTLRSLLDQGAHVVANDISTAHIQMAHRSCPEAKLLIGDMTALNFAPSTFHGAIGFYTLFHLPRSKLRGMLTKIHTWLKPGGVFAFNLATIDEEEIHGEVLGYGMFWSGYGVGHSRRLVEEVGW